MALPHTIRRFEIDLADTDRGVYERLSLRLAQHPSETDRFLIARIVARCLEHCEGLDFGPGLSNGEEPALLQRDLTGRTLARIEVGHPTAARLHKMSRAGGRIAVYCWRSPDRIAHDIAQGSVFRGDEIEVYALGTTFLDAVAATLKRAQTWALSISGGVMYLESGGEVVEGLASRVAIP